MSGKRGVGHIFTTTHDSVWLCKTKQLRTKREGRLEPCRKSFQLLSTGQQPFRFLKFPRGGKTGDGSGE